MAREWYELIPSMVYTRITEEFSESILKSYKMSGENFSTEETSDTPPVFPFTSIILLPDAPEMGMDLDGTTVNGGMVTFQIRVTDNKNVTRVRDVMGECIRIMKSMRFTTTIPAPQTLDNSYTAVCRFRRVIGAGDVL